MPEGVEPVSAAADAAPAIPPAPAPGSPVAAPAAPTWQELQEFIAKQTDRDRDLIDKWFKLACAIIGGVIAIGGITIGIVGWKTISDAKAAAEVAAKAKVGEVLQEPRIQKLVEDSARDLFAKGAFKQIIQEQTQEQLTAMHLVPRLVSAETRKKFQAKLLPFAGKQMFINACDYDEPLSFAQSVAATLTDAGLKIRVNSLSEVCQSNQKDTQLKAPDKDLAKVLNDLIMDSSGRATVTPTYDTYGRPNDTVLIINHK